MKQIFKFICCGNVDDGKSTLIGRILLDTGNVKKDQMQDAIKASKKNGSEKVELSMLLDGLLSEREQQITIDIAHRYFDYKDVRFHILDCPGHKQYTKNMAIAAAEADTAIVVIDVTKGVQEQTKNHIQICSLFNIKNICICLTKCDLITDNKNKPDKSKIDDVSNDIKKLMNLYDFSYNIIPVSAVTGFNVKKVLEQICTYAKNEYRNKKNEKNCIFHIYAAKLYQGERYYYGRGVNNVELKSGKRYNLWPNNIPITIANTVSHGCFQIKEDIDISSGDCLSNCPVIISNVIKHKTIWFDKQPKNMLLKHGSRIANIVHYTDDILELDDNIIFNNIENVKQNGFGIIIDVETKKTVGCSIFTENTNIKSNVQHRGKTYNISSDNSKDAEKQYKKLIKTLKINPVVLNLYELKNSAKNNNDLFDTINKFAYILNQNGFDVIITGGDKDISPVANKYSPFSKK